MHQEIWEIKLPDITIWVPSPLTLRSWRSTAQKVERIRLREVTLLPNPGTPPQAPNRYDRMITPPPRPLADSHKSQITMWRQIRNYCKLFPPDRRSIHRSIERARIKVLICTTAIETGVAGTQKTRQFHSLRSSEVVLRLLSGTRHRRLL